MERKEAIKKWFIELAQEALAVFLIILTFLPLVLLAK